jgi:hypothetical protein
MKKIALIILLLLIPLASCRSNRDIDYVVAGVKALEMYGVHIRVIQYEIIPRMGWFYVMYGQTEIDGENHYTISIYGNHKNRKQFRETLAHELIHVWQFHTKKLQFDEETRIVVWKGDSSSIEEIPYNNREWEIEAHSKQDSVLNLIEHELRRDEIKENKRKLKRLQKSITKAIGLD